MTALSAGLTGARSDLRVLPPSAAATLHAEAQGVATTVLASVPAHLRYLCSLPRASDPRCARRCSGYNTRFGFNQYHSMTDVLDAVNEVRQRPCAPPGPALTLLAPLLQTLLARTAGAVATALLRLSTGRTNATATANATLVRALSEVPAAR